MAILRGFLATSFLLTVNGMLFWDSCPEIPTIANGGHKIKSTFQGRIVEFFCNKGYHLIGTKIVHCKKDALHYFPPMCIFSFGQQCLPLRGHKPCDDICINDHSLLGFRCGCSLPGTELAKDGRSCKDINECIHNNFNCSHLCINTYGSALCVCPPGLIMGEDLKTCYKPFISPMSVINITAQQELLQLIFEKIVSIESRGFQQEVLLQVIAQNIDNVQHKLDTLVPQVDEVTNILEAFNASCKIPVYEYQLPVPKSPGVV